MSVRRFAMLSKKGSRDCLLLWHCPADRGRSRVKSALRLVASAPPGGLFIAAPPQRNVSASEVTRCWSSRQGAAITVGQKCV